jgi:hypothetical protein
VKARRKLTTPDKTEDRQLTKDVKDQCHLVTPKRGKCKRTSNDEIELDTDPVVTDEKVCLPCEKSKGPKSSGDSKGPKPSGDSKGPKASDDSNGPNPSDNSKEPKPSDDSKGSKPSDDSKGPKPSDDSKGPKPSDDSNGPKPSDNSKGPKSSDVSSGPSTCSCVRDPPGCGDDCDYAFHYNIVEEYIEILMEVKLEVVISKTVGFIGMAPNEDLKNSDYVVAVMDENGNGHCYDGRYEDNTKHIVKDKEDDLESSSVSKNKTHMIAKARRKLITPDKTEDRPITKDDKDKCHLVTPKRGKCKRTSNDEIELDGDPVMTKEKVCMPCSGSPNGPKSSEDLNGPKSSEDSSGSKPPKDSSGSKPPKDSSGPKSPEDSNGPKSSEDSRGPKSPEDSNGPKSAGDPDIPKASDDSKGPKSPAVVTESASCNCVKDPPGCTDKCAYELNWKTENDVWIIFNVSTVISDSDPSALVGFSSDGTMADFDGISAYFDDNNKPVCNDVHYDKDTSKIVPDAQNDVDQFTLTKINGQLNLIAKRKLVTTDSKEDKQLTKDNKYSVMIPTQGHGKRTGSNILQSDPVFTADQVCLSCSQQANGVFPVDESNKPAPPAGSGDSAPAIVNGGSSGESNSSPKPDSTKKKKPKNPNASWGSAVAGSVVFAVLFFIVICVMCCC